MTNFFVERKVSLQRVGEVVVINGTAQVAEVKGVTEALTVTVVAIALLGTGTLIIAANVGE